MRAPILAMALGALIVPIAATAQDHRRYRDAVLVCESRDGRTRECAADVRGDVRLLRQLSRSECVEDRTWGQMRGGIWVSDGCRGEFLVSGWHRGRRSATVSEFVRCESHDGRSNRCRADTRGGVEVVRQLSHSPCIRGQNWGWTEHGIWVSGGCRAEFRTAAGRRDADDGVPAITRCESIDGERGYCEADTRGGVRMIRQRSRLECIEGETWGYDRRGIWVAGGCHADFETDGQDRAGWARRER